MATGWRVIIREAAKRVNAVTGATASTMATNYATSPLTTTEIDDPVYNLAFLQDVIIDTHGHLALEIASVADNRGIGCHPWRAFFADVTASVNHEGSIPTTGTGSKSIIGALGQPYNAGDTDQILTMASAERVSNYRLFVSNEVYTLNPYLYHVDGHKVYCTVSSVVFPCCVYERSDYVTTMAANGSIALPDSLADALVAGAVSALLIEDEYAAQSAYYKAIYDQAVMAIRAQKIVVPGLAMAI